jgi:hypothetical protein
MPKREDAAVPALRAADAILAQTKINDFLLKSAARHPSRFFVHLKQNENIPRSEQCFRGIRAFSIFYCCLGLLQ